ncbi:DUF6864 domain-containing function, partial [Vibrio metoecus]
FSVMRCQPLRRALGLMNNRINMQLKLRTETKDVLASGTLITFGSEESIFELTHNGECLTLRVKFVDEDGKNWKEHRETKFDPVSATEGRFTFFNFNNNLGVYTTKPAYIGDIGGRELFFQYKIDDMTESVSKVIFYTFYLGGSVNG